MLDPSGREVGVSGNPPGVFETVFLEAPAAGTYTVVVRGVAGSAETFAGKVVGYRLEK